MKRDYESHNRFCGMVRAILEIHDCFEIEWLGIPTMCYERCLKGNAREVRASISFVYCTVGHFLNLARHVEEESMLLGQRTSLGSRQAYFERFAF